MGQTAERSAPYQVFMLALCLLALLWLALDTLIQFDPQTRQVLFYADTIVALIFMGDFLASLARAESRWRYLGTWGWIDFLSSIPAVGILRVGRAARIARILRVLRAVRSGKVLAQHLAARRAESALLSTLLATLLVITLGSIAVLDVERAAGGNIDTASDAFWWAVVTVSTAGFGDLFPITAEGRAIAVAMMIFGIGIFGTFTAFVASWFLAPKRAQEDEKLAAIRSDLEELKDLLRRQGAGLR